MKIGLKLFSTNHTLLQEIEALYHRDYFNYIELYIVPSTYHDSIQQWRTLKIPFVVHAPHSFHGFNLAISGKRTTNHALFFEAQRFADDLAADVIIVHAGNNGPVQEALWQIEQLRDKRIVIENKPAIGIKGERCVGSTPEEIALFVEVEAVSGMALDFVHAMCTANYLKRDPYALIESFLAFDPTIYHLSDGDHTSSIDRHLSLGKGNLAIAKILEYVPIEGQITLETPKESGEGLSDFVKDIEYLRTCTNSAAKRSYNIL